jgi:hypothetical protein
MTDYRNFTEDRTENPFSFAPKVVFVPQRERVVRKLKVAVSVISAILILVIGFFI